MDGFAIAYRLEWVAIALQQGKVVGYGLVGTKEVVMWRKAETNDRLGKEVVDWTCWLA